MIVLKLGGCLFQSDLAAMQADMSARAKDGVIVIDDRVLEVIVIPDDDTRVVRIINGRMHGDG